MWYHSLLWCLGLIARVMSKIAWGEGEAKPNAILDITRAINPKYHSKLCYYLYKSRGQWFSIAQ